MAEQLDLKISVMVGTCEKTNLPLRADFLRLEAGENGAIDIKYTVHTLDLLGEIHKEGRVIENIQYFPYPLNKGGDKVETPLTPKMQILLENLKENILEIMQEQLVAENENEDQV